MSRFAPGRPSPAMVVAITALIVALGGTGYAALKLPKSSVGTAQLKRNASPARRSRTAPCGWPTSRRARGDPARRAP